MGPLPEIAKTPRLVDAMVAMDDVLDQLKAGLPGDRHEEGTTARRLATHTTVLLLLEQLRDLADHDQPSTSDGLALALKHITESCTACHKAHRNERNNTR